MIHRVCFLTIVLVALCTATSEAKTIRVGMIGLDTSHVLTFAKAMTDPKADVRIVAAFPGGSPDVKLSHTRVGKFTKAIKGHGIEICDSVESLLEKVDAVMITAVDGRPHLAYARQVLPTGKPTFIDKPVAGNLIDACEIYALAAKYNTPCFCTSALRYDKAAIKSGKVAGRVLGCSTYSPMSLEEHHPDLYWYGIHGVEPLFAVMGTGIATVSRTHTKDTDVVVGVWKDGRVGVFRGTRSGPRKFGGMVFGSKKVTPIGEYDRGKQLNKVIARFFKTKKVPVPAEETLEIYAFMSAADVSKAEDGKPVDVQKLLAEAKTEAARRMKMSGGKNVAKKKTDLAALKEKWVSLFDGKTLAGWHQEGDGEWIVEEGAIVGKTDKAAKLYGHLVSDRKFKNFKVRFKFKSVAGNSGFYVRAHIEKPDQTHGLQVEVDPRNDVGGIYESYGRRWIGKPSKKTVKKSYKLDGWNEMEIVAKDGYVATHVNGTKVAELLDDPAQQSGHLILQMHAGNKMLVYFKDIEILELP